MKVDYPKELDKCEEFGEIFELVKRAVKEVLGRRRVGLMLFLADLPIHVGAYHGLGSNSIVLNRRFLEAVRDSAKSRREINSYIFLVLLHEYLHSLGYTDELEVKRLSLKVVGGAFGGEHPLARMALKGPASLLSKLSLRRALNLKPESPKLIKDFEKISQPYIQ